MTQIFPLILITLSACAAAVYAWHLDYWRMIYWIGAVVLNIAVLKMK